MTPRDPDDLSATVGRHADRRRDLAPFLADAERTLRSHRDDPNLLRHAQRAKDVGRNPQVVEYRPEFGPSASYYAWEAAGRPVHGVRR